MKRILLIMFLALIFSSCSNKNPVAFGNRSPVIKGIEASPDVIHVRNYATITVYAEDPDGDNLTYEWSASLGYIVGNGNKVRYFASECCEGRNTISVTVKDGKGGEASASVYVTVIP